MKIETVQNEIRWSLGFIDSRAFDPQFLFPAITFVKNVGRDDWRVSLMCDPRYYNLYPNCYSDEEVEVILARHPEGTVTTRYEKMADNDIEIKSYGDTEVYRHFPHGVVWRDLKGAGLGLVARSEDEAVQYLFDKYKHRSKSMKDARYYVIRADNLAKSATLDEAIKEAERLAKQHSGVGFLVVQALSVSKSKVMVETEELK